MREIERELRDIERERKRKKWNRYPGVTETWKKERY